MLCPPFSRAADAVALACIRGYQKYLSPRKGFSCPHRLVHGGASCSEFIRLAVASHGLRHSLPLARERFGRCHEAGQVLARRRRGGQPFASTPGEGTLGEGTPDDAPNSRRGRRRSRRGASPGSQQSWCGRMCDKYDPTPLDAPCSILDRIFDCGPGDSGCIDCGP